MLKAMIFLAIAALGGCSIIDLEFNAVENGCSTQAAGAWCDPMSAKAQALKP